MRWYFKQYTSMFTSPFSGQQDDSVRGMLSGTLGLRKMSLRLGSFCNLYQNTTAFIEVSWDHRMVSVCPGAQYGDLVRLPTTGEKLGKLGILWGESPCMKKSGNLVNMSKIRGISGTFQPVS